MLTKEELASLRKEGASDIEILSGYREYNNSHNSDIDGLLKDGVKAGAILDGLAEYRAPAPKPEPKAETWGDTARNFGKAVQYGGASVASGLGKSLEAAGYDTVGPILQNAGRKIVPDAYEPAASKFNVTDPSSYGYIPRALVEGAPGAIVDIGGALAGGAAGALAGPAGVVPGFIAGGTAAHTARSYGDNLEDRLHYQGKTLKDATGKDQAIALGASAAEGALGAVGVRGAGGALSSVTKGAGAQALAQLPAQIVQAGARDAVAGVAGNVAQQVGRTVDTDPGLSVSLNEAANAGALSGAGSAALRTVRATGDVYQSGRMRGLMDDTESSTRVADAIVGTRLDVSDPKQAAGAIRLVEGQLQRATKTDEIKALLKDSDQETRAAVADSLDRLRRGYELTEDQIGDLRNRLGSTPAGMSLIGAVTDLHTLQRVKALGEFKDGGFSNPGAAGSVVGRLTNPLNRYTLGAGAAGGAAAYALPAVAQSAALANVLGAAPAVLAGAGVVQGALRGSDALLGTRRPLDQFTSRFSGFDRPEGGAPAGLPAYAPQPSADPSRIEAQTNRAWQRFQAMQAAEEARSARQAAQTDQAWASRELDPQAKAAQEDALWRTHEAQEARTQAEATAAEEAIRQGYTVLADRARMAETRRAQQEAQARTQAAAQQAADARLSANRQRDFERAQAQIPALTEKAKAAQIRAMYRDHADQDARSTPRDWNDSEAVAAIRAAEAARQSQSDAVLAANAIERAAQNPTPIDDVVRAQPKAQTDAQGRSNARNKAKSEGDTFEHDGISHPIPDNVQNRAGYIKSIKRKQAQIDGYIRRAQDDGFISGKTDDAISDMREELKTARNKKQARQTVERIARQADPHDREHIVKTFDEDFYNIWIKDE